MNQTNNYEIERKYLIKKPNPDLLRKKEGFREISIRQTYLISGPEGENRRVRSWTENGHTHFFFTEKKKISNIKRIENEREISAGEADLLLAEADPDLQTIEKVRYRFLENALCYEIDIFPFWEHQAYLEVEITSEDEIIPWPQELELLREVTEDPAYTNHALAKSIPEED